MLALVSLALEGCATSGSWRLARPASPHERYREMLERTRPDDDPAVLAWRAEAAAALDRAPLVTLPRHWQGRLAPGDVRAVSYRMDLEEGRRLALELRPLMATPGQIFLDVHELDEDGEPRRVTSLLPDTLGVTHDVRRDTTLVVRVQPSLEWSGEYVLTARTLASLPFPVQGLSARAVQSGFGAEREAGRRAHEGIDIFAPRGTPVVAVVSGIAQPSSNGLGGTVVWLQEPDARRTFYYAHLDRQAFTDTRPVVAGEVLGYVGNTGNARTTAPHLHFGIYDDGPRDPLPYVRPDDPLPPMPLPSRGTDTQ